MDQGVNASELEVKIGRRAESASVAAFRRRFVVPSAFVDPDRAEQTMASL